ncbi:MAG TPA: carbonic anhydrase family protein, partial [Thermoanaerobaculia bacterium]|nr:carbonic anhydrase family protein [Thermoanaerobaculia bacterium]
SYRLIQFHFHTPCEHCADRPKFSMELHLVHKNDDGETAVVGVRLDPDGPNATFQAFLETIPDSGRPGGVAALDPRDLLPEKLGYVHYPGSLTTPACNEGVLWHVLAERITVSEDQMKRFQRRYPKTARPLQQRGDRLPQRSRD